jgi:predicted metal-dependent hydrolase
MRHKWGSCSARGTLTLALDLAEQHERFQDFVIVHELLHMRVPTHGRLFKALMSVYLPGWRRLEVERGNDAGTSRGLDADERRRVGC